MKNLKPIQVLTADAICLIERAKMRLEVYNAKFDIDSTAQIISDLEKLIADLKE
jgi:hypothetical protein